MTDFTIFQERYRVSYIDLYYMRYTPFDIVEESILDLYSEFYSWDNEPYAPNYLLAVL